MSNYKKINSVLNEWLVGMSIVSYEFSGGFRIRFERNEGNVDPQVLYLDIKATALVGNEGDWPDFVKALPMKMRRGEEEEPALAYRLMLLIGSHVKDVDLAEEGDLVIGTTDNEEIRISGVDDVWEESWVLSEGEDLTGKKHKFVACDSLGNLSMTEHKDTGEG